MAGFFKGQVQVVSVLMITGIIVALIGVAYMWGAPMMNKRTTITEFSNVQTFMSSLNDRLTDIANSGRGEEIFDLPIGGINVVPYDDSGDDANSIIVEFPSSQPMVLSDTEVYLGGAVTEIEEVGTYGVSEPFVMTLSSNEKVGTDYIIRIKLHYRELDSPRNGYKIALETEDDTINYGDSKIRLSYDGTETIHDAAGNGGDLILTKIKVEVS